MGIIMQNLMQISEAVAAFIEHSETRISQKGIANFVKIVLMMVKIDPQMVL